MLPWRVTYHPFGERSEKKQEYFPTEQKAIRFLADILAQGAGSPVAEHLIAGNYRRATDTEMRGATLLHERSAKRQKVGLRELEYIRDLAGALMTSVKRNGLLSQQEKQELLGAFIKAHQALDLEPQAKVEEPATKVEEVARPA